MKTEYAHHPGKINQSQMLLAMFSNQLCFCVLACIFSYSLLEAKPFLVQYIESSNLSGLVQCKAMNTRPDFSIIIQVSRQTSGN